MNFLYNLPGILLLTETSSFPSYRAVYVKSLELHSDSKVRVQAIGVLDQILKLVGCHEATSLFEEISDSLFSQQNRLEVLSSFIDKLHLCLDILFDESKPSGQFFTCLLEKAVRLARFLKSQRN